ncbi:ferredoxin--NADP reductase [Aromatoleum sp.]|uniref:ferredoxin--NADP reductase n=1 Tax=Aromatoleum sp. TaxID=2307007 RepID=UPI002FC91377
MPTPADRFTTECILAIRRWTPHLFSFRTTRDATFRFVPGQFARLGLRKDDDEVVWRAYSMVSAPYDEHLEFYSIVVPDGEFTSRLAQLAEGDDILVERMNYGFLTTDRFVDGRDLWLIATGTGLAPYISILHDPATWTDYERIVLVHSVRFAAELAYRAELADLAAHPLVGGAAHKLRYVPIVTREPVDGALQDRIPTLIENGELERAAGFPLDHDRSRIMLCGNPQMVDDGRKLLNRLGYKLSRRAAPAHLVVENMW